MSAPVRDAGAPAHGPTRVLLAAGAAAGPLFYGVVTAEALTRPGFDLLRHPLSLLSVGPGGWVQSLDFCAAGILALAGALGLRQVLPRERLAAWKVGLLGLFGLGTFVAGCFRPDPAMGFPPGTPPGAPASQSAHSMLHGVGFDLSFLALIVAAFLFARSFAAIGRHRMAAASLLAGLLTPALIVGGFLNPATMGLCFFGAGLVGFGWLTATMLAQLG